jgi:AcrR family transcriptional regulator
MPKLKPATQRARREHILDAAELCFACSGFHRTTMQDICKEGGVSPGALYVYFDSKEALFVAIADEQCHKQAESVFVLDEADRDVAGALTRLGNAFATFMCNRSPSPIRTVIAIADRMPEIGRQFYETGPAVGIGKLSRYLQAQVAAGVLDIDIADCDIVAAQFLESCLAGTFKPVLFNFAPPPPPERIAHVVSIAVRVFMKAHGTA